MGFMRPRANARIFSIAGSIAEQGRVVDFEHGPS